MLYKKFCCDGMNAIKVHNLTPVYKDGVKWYTALYKCSICGSYTIRGETNQKVVNSTSVEFISEERARELMGGDYVSSNSGDRNLHPVGSGHNIR